MQINQCIEKLKNSAPDAVDTQPEQREISNPSKGRQLGGCESREDHSHRREIFRFSHLAQRITHISGESGYGACDNFLQA
jgi:hypothetical protein